ncbi:MAG: TlpA family protein disulfide reductase [Tenuifilaceae bacterium]
MKKYLVFFLLPLMAACTKGPKEAVISGTFLNFKDTVVYLNTKGITENIKVNADKTFEYKVTLDKPAYFSLRASRKGFEVYVNPGDSTKITVDFDNLKDGAKFSGKLEAENKYLVERNAIVRGYMSNYKEVYTLDNEQFKLKLDSLKKEITEKISVIPNKEIALLETTRTDYLINTFKVNYPGYNAYYNSVELNPDSVDYSFLDGLDLNSAYHLMYVEYSQLVSTVIENKFRKELGDVNLDSVPVEKLTKMFGCIDKNVVNPEVRDYLKQNAFMEDLSYGEFWKLTDVVNKFLAECQTVGYKNIIEKLYNQKMLIAPGKTAPLFKYKDINGKEVALEDLKGKLVYIDFWATWCGPCRHELPYLEEVEKAYEGKNIYFISMSVDDDMVAWDKMVKEQKMKGIQLHADGAWNSIAAKEYQVKGIPTFVLIDHNGIIITPAAPRPSQGKTLTDLFDENLAKI